MCQLFNFDMNESIKYNYSGIRNKIESFEQHYRLMYVLEIFLLLE